MTKVLCSLDDCIYYIHKPEDGEAYQDQCGNDEIEIAPYEGHVNVAMCYSYEPIDQSG